jgi:glycosyltransferase involved in cell wall biosynthesis
MLQPARGSTDWERDGGLLCLAFRTLGMDTRFIAIDRPRVHEDEPRIDASLTQMIDPEWWRRWQLEGVVLYSWAAPRYEPVALAIKSAGITLIIKVDCGAEKSPRVGWWSFYKSTETFFRDQRRPFPQVLALLKTVVFSLFRAVYDRPMLNHLSHADVIGVESPLAAQLLKDLFHAYRRPELTARVVVAPHPVTTDMVYARDTEKHDIIVAVGRWDAYGKDAPKLVAVLNRVLAIECKYRAKIIGSSIEMVAALVETLHPGVRGRIELVGAIPHNQLFHYYQEAKIHFTASRSESGPLTAGEALCCGCSVVGSATLPPLHFFTGDACGSLAINRSTTRFADAIFCEIEAWRSGARDPGAISALWQRRVHAPAVAAALLARLSSLSHNPACAPSAV